MAARNRIWVLDVLFAIFLLIGGGFFLVSGILVVNTYTFTSGCQRTTGTVIRNEYGRGRHAALFPVVHFQVDGKTIEFVGKTSVRPSPYAVDERVTVLYVPANPHVALIDNFFELHLLALIFAVPGVAFLSLGGGYFLWRILLYRRRARIIALGVPEPARVIEIKVDKSVTVNQQHPWVLIAQFRDEVSNQNITCESHYLWDNPSFRYPVGSAVTVFHLQDQPQKCAFQLDKPPGQA